MKAIARVWMAVALLLGATGAASSQELDSDPRVPPSARNVDATRDRTVVFPTAVSAPARRFSFTGIGAAIWEINYQFSDTLQAGGYTVLPVGVVGVIPQINLRVPLAAGVAFGAGVLGGIGAPYGAGSNGFGALGMAHTELTFHNRDHMLTLTVAGGAGFYHEDLEFVSVSPGYLLVPAVGYRYAFHPNWSFQLEVGVPIPLKDYEGAEQSVIVVYGLRGHGGSLFGDIGFALPLYETYIQNFWQYTPIGIPYFSLGFIL